MQIAPPPAYCSAHGPLSLARPVLLRTAVYLPNVFENALPPLQSVSETRFGVRYLPQFGVWLAGQRHFLTKTSCFTGRCNPSRPATPLAGHLPQIAACPASGVAGLQQKWRCPARPLRLVQPRAQMRNSNCVRWSADTRSPLRGWPILDWRCVGHETSLTVGADKPQWLLNREAMEGGSPG